MTTELRNIRVRRVNVEKFTQSLRDAGFTASWTPGATGAWNGGCTDPECCYQHDAAYSPEDWATIETNCSGNQAHKLWAARGWV